MTVDAAPAQPFSYTGKFFNMLGLTLKNALLSILTLTLYRFWARTSVRRRIWSRILVLGDPLEYTGTAWELFRGFLISLPCFFLPAIFVFYVAPLVMDPIAATWLALGFYVIAVPLIAAARYWMRRYQLSRTRWRGIRFGLAGSAWSFAFASWGWSILQSLSLGWYTPVARMNRARLLWTNARFGDQPFEFIDDGKSPQSGLWWPFAMGWIGATFAVLFSYFLVFAAAFAMGAAGMLSNEDATAAAPIFVAMGVGVIVLAFVLITIAWIPYNAAAMNRIASLISLDGARFRLRAKTFSLLGITLAGWVIVIFSLGLLAPLAGFLQVRYVIARLEVVGTPRFAEIGQSIVAETRAGESLGDAFDLDMGVGIV